MPNPSEDKGGAEEVGRKIREQTQKHAKGSKEIQWHVGHVAARVASPQAATDAGAAEEELTNTHFMEDPVLEGVPEEQRNLMLKSVEQFLAKIVNNGSDPEQRQEEEPDDVESSDEEEDKEKKNGEDDDGFSLDKEERKETRKEARGGASRGGLLAVETTNTERQAATTVTASQLAAEEQQTNTCRILLSMSCKMEEAKGPCRPACG